ncbi:hypothetical protein CUJ83_05600 [Methanocella sp. CWC-04]|uniref:Transcription regulator TrmB C-terminal domain-containing protein n=1 Tax=Methanooceanicella nereidis TaxID=2052831 RepID=A0AAP2RC11_9EURY|nr:TrmB family transcriptional regulator sugar-binding domain-containing protein [Methanocella sp. CWC-04]MCD1294474.1 hypothetical protein [Methanocella sp. CWC-04]
MESLEKILEKMGLDDDSKEVFSYMAVRRRASLEDIFNNTNLSMAAISKAVYTLMGRGAIKREGQILLMDNIQSSLTNLLSANIEDINSSIASYRQSAVTICDTKNTSIEVVHDDVSAVPSFTAGRIASASNSVEIVTRSLTWLDGETLRAIQEASNRGVLIRVITYHQPELEEGIKALKDAGVKVRSHEYSRDVRFIVADGEFVAFAIREPPRTTSSSYFGLWINSRDACSKVLEHIFEPAWQEAENV